MIARPIHSWVRSTMPPFPLLDDGLIGGTPFSSGFASEEFGVSVNLLNFDSILVLPMGSAKMRP